MEKQMTLFKTNNKKNKQECLTKSDKIYQQFPKKLARELHIYQGGTMCHSIALDYVDNGDLVGEDVNTICKRSNHTHSHQYYHYINHKFIWYDSWLLGMILKTEIQASK